MEKLETKNDVREILLKLARLQKDVNYLKEHMVTEEDLLTQGDMESLDRAEKDLKEGKTKRLK